MCYIHRKIKTAILIYFVYFLLRKSTLNVDALFQHEGEYAANNGWNKAGIVALIIGVIPNIPGFLHAAGIVSSVPSIFDTLYAYAWFVGLFVASVVYLLLSRSGVASRIENTVA